MSTQNSSPSKPFDPYEYLQIVQDPDGNLTCKLDYPNASTTSNPSLPNSVLSKDVTINKSKNTWARLFLPKRVMLSDGSASNRKLPLIVYFHSGGFILASASTVVVHNFCEDMADSTEAVVASLDYRLAPKHRLPAAYDDAMEMLDWIRSSEDEWLTHYVDYSKCYLTGHSAGANIAYHIGLRVAEEVDHFEPLKIQGLILRQPFFGGTKRTESELRLQNDSFLPLCVTDLMWELSLPIGVDRDHEYCNLRAGDGPKKLDKIRKLGWRVLVSGTGEDILIDRGKELVQLLKEKGVHVVSDFQKDGGHEVEFGDPLKAKQLIELLKGFISSSGA